MRVKGRIRKIKIKHGLLAGYYFYLIYKGKEVVHKSESYYRAKEGRIDRDAQADLFKYVERIQ